MTDFNPDTLFRRNPYIIGRPLFKHESLFGRKAIFNLISDHLENNVRIILFYGQRRVGKTSIIRQISQNIEENIRDQFIFISLDFQDKIDKSLKEILKYMANKILDELQIDEEDLQNLANDISDNSDIFDDIFLPNIYDYLGHKKLVFICDEFDVLSESNNNSAYIIQLAQRHDRLFIIPVVGRNLSRLPNLISLLHEAPHYKIRFLDQRNTQEIITQSDTVFLRYQPEAIEAIFNLSAGHPFFIQVICSALYNLARDRYKNNPIPDSLQITDEDVENVIDTAIEAGEGALDFWHELSPEEQIILPAVAEAQKIAIVQNQSIPEQPLTLLKKYGIVSTKSLQEVYKQLAEYEVLDDTKCRLKVRLFRCWLEQKHQLKEEINNVEKIKQKDIDDLISVAINNPESALHIYDQALQLNPNNFKNVGYLAAEYLKSQNLDKACKLYDRAYLFYSINNQQNIVLEPLLRIAKQYLQNKNFEQDIEVYTRAYEIDLEGSKNGLVKTRKKYIHELIVNREWTKATQQCDLILQIDPNNDFAQERGQEINVLKTKTNLQTETENTKPIKPPIATASWLKRSSILIASLGLAGIVVIGAGISQVFRTCLTGERKELGVFCVVDNSRISRGDRTFSPETTNIPRDKGIQALKKGDYPQAANLFKQAIKAKQNDPEVLIYYNNALARQQGSPFTLAVVVPLDKDQDDRNDAQEILRGVAQAQNQFNSNKGLNGRLLEIVIANDSNTEKAKEVAQSLIKDSSILGVIGHNSSDDTKAALPEYAKAKLAVISPTSTSILLNNPVFFRAVYSDESAGKTLAEYTYKSLKLKKAVVFGNPNSPYSNSIREVFTNQFEKLGSEVVHKPLIDLTAPTFDAEKEVAKSVYSNKAEAALLFPDTRSTKIALKIAIETTKRNETLKTKNPPRPELKMLAGDTLYNNETLTSGGKNVEGLIIAIPWFRETPQAQSFAKKAEQQWGGGISWRTATSFDATQALIKALSNNPSRSTVLGRLENVSLSANETSGDPLKFTPEREREGQSILLQIKGGKFMPIDSVKP